MTAEKTRKQTWELSSVHFHSRRAIGDVNLELKIEIDKEPTRKRKGGRLEESKQRVPKTIFFRYYLARIKRRGEKRE